MPTANYNRLVRQGIEAIEHGNTLMALVHLEEAATLRATPTVNSYLAYCLAKERRQMQQAVQLCLEAIRQEPGNSIHALNLGRIYLLGGNKGRAIQTFRKGLKLGRNQQIIKEIKSLGLRKSPPLSSLDRDHPLNKFLGIAFSKLGFR